MDLRDHLRVLRDYRTLIVVMTLVAAAASLAHSLREKPTYRAQSVLIFQIAGQQNQELDVYAGPPQPDQATRALTATTARTIIRPDSMERVRHALRTSVSLQTLTSSVEVQAPPNAPVVAIGTRAATAGFAARLADEVAREAVRVANRRLRASTGTLEAIARRQIPRLRRVPRSLRLFYAQEIGRLQAVGRQARGARIANPAPAQVTPVPPARGRNVALGTAFGLLAALIAAFVAEAVGRRLSTAREVEGLFGLRVLGRVSDESLGRIGATTGGSGGGSALDPEPFRRIRGNLQVLESGSRLRSILVTSALPEEGKSTVAGSLAFVTAMSGRRTLLVECDLRRPAVAARLGLERTPGLTECMAREATREEVTRRVRFEDTPSVAHQTEQAGRHMATGWTLDCIPAGSPTPSAAELLGSSRFKEFLAEVREDYETVLLDSSPLLPVADTLALVSQGDAIVLCARLRRITRGQAEAVLATLERFPSRPMGLVVTGTRRRDEVRGLVPARRDRPYILRSA